MENAKKHTMMRGTGGQLDYLMIARQDGVGLGIKPNVIGEGQAPNTTYVGIRLRSAPMEGKRPSKPEDGNVVPFTPLALDTAWDGIEWEKVDNLRASTQLGVFLQGTLANDTEVLLEEMSDSKLSKKMADYVLSLVNPDFLCVTPEDVIEWLELTYSQAAAHVSKAIEDKKAIVATISSNIGVVGTQSELMKKMYNKNASGDEVDDLDDEDIEEADGEA